MIRECQYLMSLEDKTLGGEDTKINQKFHRDSENKTAIVDCDG